MLSCLHRAITRAAHAAPDHPAIRMSGAALTYADLERRSNRLSHILFDRGVRRGDRVGIYAHKSLDVAVALYGIMKAGAAYVPMNPDAPASQLRKIVRDCDIRHLVSEQAKETAVLRLSESTALQCCVGIEPEQDAELPCVGWDEVAHAPDESAADGGIMEQDLAYVLYTSGSTGNPKGIAHSHRSALSFAEVAAATYGFQPNDRITNHAPLHFDLSTLDYFATAVAGATTIVIPEPYTKVPASLSQLLESERVTVLYAVPFALMQLLLRGAMHTRELPALRWVLFGGEPFPTKHLRALMERIPQARFSNVYGPTETNGCTYYLVPPLPADSDEPIPIGRPYENVEALVVDADDRPTAPGETGELLIRSPTRMRGYWGQPDLTARATFHRPAPAGDDDVFHRTGDLVQVQPDGNFRMLGRKDRQIKTRGYRVELDEVEAALLALPSVEEAAAYAVPDGEGSQRIEAMVILNDGARPTGGGRNDLMKQVRGHLPPYAVPAKVDVVTSFPRTTTGKIDRRRLHERAARTTGGHAASETR